MATTSRSRKTCSLVGFALWLLVQVWATAPSRLFAEAITSDSFQIEISTNLAWMDNNSNPLVQIASARQSGMQRAVAEANPYIRITNVSTDARLVAAQLNLSKAESSIDNVDWISTPGRANWFWDSVAKHAHFQFVDPVLPGDSAIMRVSTASLAGTSNLYSMFQNLFQPSSSPYGTGSYFGILHLMAQPATSTQSFAFDPDTYLPLGEFTEIDYNLKVAPVKSYAISDQDSRVGIQTLSGQVVAVPEPGTLAMMAGALATLGGWGFYGRRKMERRRRLFCFCWR